MTHWTRVLNYYAILSNKESWDPSPLLYLGQKRMAKLVYSSLFVFFFFSSLTPISPFQILPYKCSNLILFLSSKYDPNISFKISKFFLVYPFPPILSFLLFLHSKYYITILIRSLLSPWWEQKIQGLQLHKPMRHKKKTVQPINLWIT